MIAFERRLRVLASPDESVAGRSWPLLEGPALVVGRDPGKRGLAIDDKELSRRHVALGVGEGGVLEVSDLGSKNGTLADRARLVGGTHRSWSDAVVRVGDTILHAGFDLPSVGRATPLDPLIDRLARDHATHGSHLAFEAPPSSGVRTLGRQLHRRTSDPRGPLLLVAPGDWTPGAVAFPRHSLVVLMGAGEVSRDDATALCEAASRADARLVLVAQRFVNGAGRAFPNAARLTLPAPSGRRAALWAVTRGLLREALGTAAPPFRPGAVAVWLWAPFPRGWETVRTRVGELVPIARGEKLIRSRHVRKTTLDS